MLIQAQRGQTVSSSTQRWPSSLRVQGTASAAAGERRRMPGARDGGVNETNTNFSRTRVCCVGSRDDRTETASIMLL